jgi:hypothetical protein
MSQETKTPLIYGKLARIMGSISAIGKDNKNQQQGYNFRGIDDVMNELHSHFAKEGVIIMPRVINTERSERTNKSGTALLYVFLTVTYAFYAEDGSFVECTVEGEAMDMGDKATNKALSAALKYALMQMLLIPTKEPKDSENDSYEVAPKAKQAPAKKPLDELSALKHQLWHSTADMREIYTTEKVKAMTLAEVKKALEVVKQPA